MRRMCEEVWLPTAFEEPRVFAGIGVPNLEPGPYLADVEDPDVGEGARLTAAPIHELHGGACEVSERSMIDS